MFYRLLCFTCLFFPLLVFSQRYSETSQPHRIIETGPGPEDMVLDTFSGRERLLISCCERRSEKPGQSQVWSYAFGEDKAKILPRKNHPDSIAFYPHGIDIGMHNGQPCLLVVNHEEKKNRHSVLRYYIYADHLEFDTIFSSPLIVSPNDVLAGVNGDFWITNDASSRHSSLGLLLKVKSGSVVYYDGHGTYRYAAKGFSYPNGLIRIQDNFFVSTSRQNKIFSMSANADGTLNKKQKRVWAKATGWDNITAVNDTLLLSTAHVKPLKFLHHRNDMNSPSPVAVFAFSTKAPGQRLIYYTGGDEISAGSTAIWYRRHLYICQVFNAFVLDVTMEQP